MRKTFTNLETTPTPTECKKARDDYKAHCNKMREEKLAYCEKLAAYKKLNPNCGKNCLADHLSELKSFYDNNEVQKKIKKDKSSTPQDIELAQELIEENNKGIRKYLAEVNKGVPKIKAGQISAALKGLAAREITRRVLLFELRELSKKIVKPCEKPSPIIDPDCPDNNNKKKHSERLKQKRQRNK